MATILIADDHPDIRNLLVLQLSKHGFSCVEARNGREVLEQIESQCPDLILLDMNMPELDGWQAATEIRCRKSSIELPIIALTAYSLPGDRARALAAGCNAFRCKPIDFKQLLEDIARILAEALGRTHRRC